MNFIRENLLKIVVVMVITILLIVFVVSCTGPSNETAEEKYGTMEEKMVVAAQNMAEKSKSFLPDEIGDKKTIKLSTMVHNEEIKELHAIEDSNVICSGYVLIQKKGEDNFAYIPHLKCGKYYETLSIADYILKNEEIVTSDDGLYTNGADFYTYKGENPNNYLLIDEFYYRIISINNKKELKIVSVEDFDSTVWDDRFNSEKDDYVGINNFEKSRLKEYLDYIYESEDFLSDKIRSYIVPHDICIGKRSEADNNNISGTVECSKTLENQYIGLIQTNDYLNASTDSGCISGSNNECSNYNYFMNISSGMMTQTASADDSSSIYVVDDGVLELEDAEDDNDVYPVFYLDANTLYKSGNGTQNNPYILR